MRSMRFLLSAGVMALAASLAAQPASAQMSHAAATVPMVGGAPMYPSKTIVENAGQAKNLTTLVAAAKAGGLVSTCHAEDGAGRAAEDHHE